MKGKVNHCVGMPLYCCAWLSPSLFVVAGGGGRAKTGVKNGLVVFDVCVEHEELKCEERFAHFTGADPVFSLGVSRCLENNSVCFFSVLRIPRITFDFKCLVYTCNGDVVFSEVKDKQVRVLTRTEVIPKKHSFGQRVSLRISNGEESSWASVWTTCPVEENKDGDSFRISVLECPNGKIIHHVHVSHEVVDVAYSWEKSVLISLSRDKKVHMHRLQSNSLEGEHLSSMSISSLLGKSLYPVGLGMSKKSKEVEESLFCVAGARGQSAMLCVCDLKDDELVLLSQKRLNKNSGSCLSNIEYTLRGNYGCMGSVEGDVVVFRENENRIGRVMSKLSHTFVVTASSITVESEENDDDSVDNSLRVLTVSNDSNLSVCRVVPSGMTPRNIIFWSIVFVFISICARFIFMILNKNDSLE